MPIERGMVIASIRLQPEEAHRTETLEILRSIQGPVQACAGCRSCRISAEEGEDEAICFSETWDDEDSLHRHVKSDLYSRVLSALDLSRAAPEISFYQVSYAEGIDLIKRLRTPDGDPGLAESIEDRPTL